MIHFILQTIAFQLLFLLVYDVFLKKETFFNINRIYLICTPILSFIIPFIELTFVKETIPQEYYIQLPAVILEGQATNSTQISQTALFKWEYLWHLGSLISLIIFIRKLIKINSLKQSGTLHSFDNITVVLLKQTNAAFSFFNTIFIGDNLSKNQKETILKHERIHIKEKHTLDLLFFEILRIINWFNPLIYIYQKRIAVLQEYIVDAQIIAKEDKSEYYQSLLSEVFQTDNISFINTFFNHSLIKKRITMLQKTKSKKIVQLKYLLLVPIVAVMLVYTSCTQEASAQQQEQKELSESEIINKIEELKDEIAKKGNISDEEDKALKKLMVLTMPDGMNSPYFEEVADSLVIPFGVAEKTPVYPGCEGLSKKENISCFTTKVSEFVMNNFDKKVANSQNLSGNHKIKIAFVISRSGEVSDVTASTSNSALAKEAERIVNLLPRMTPAQHSGKNVAVPFILPVLLNME